MVLRFRCDRNRDGSVRGRSDEGRLAHAMVPRLLAFEGVVQEQSWVGGIHSQRAVSAGER